MYAKEVRSKLSPGTEVLFKRTLPLTPLELFRIVAVVDAMDPKTWVSVLSKAMVIGVLRHNYKGLRISYYLATMDFHLDRVDMQLQYKHFSKIYLPYHHVIF
jgi:hypothetical protein